MIVRVNAELYSLLLDHRPAGWAQLGPLQAREQLHCHGDGQVIGNEHENPEPHQADGLGLGVQEEQGGGTQLGSPPVDAPQLHCHGSQLKGSVHEHPEPGQADGLGAGVQVEKGGGTQLGPPPVDNPLTVLLLPG